MEYIRKYLSLALLLSLFSVRAFAQGEILATVRVSTPQLQKTDRRVFDQLENTLKEFLNNTKWTQDVFEPEERIKCNFILTISEEQDNNTFKGELAVQATRWVYGSGYETSILSHLDKDVIFTYEQNQPVEFVVDVVDNPNLSALFAYYVYVILSLDYDSFSLYGGDPYVLIANNIVNNIQNSTLNNTPGWRPSNGDKNRSRYWLAENLMSPRIRPFRAAMYGYYRKGLDLMSSNVEQGKESILNSLEEIDKVSNAYINSMIVQMFVNAKRDELVEMWKVGARTQKERVVQIMSKIDPANGQRYRDITN
jgi:hypothetical protein